MFNILDLFRSEKQKLERRRYKLEERQFHIGECLADMQPLKRFAIDNGHREEEERINHLLVKGQLELAAIKTELQSVWKRLMEIKLKTKIPAGEKFIGN